MVTKRWVVVTAVVLVVLWLGTTARGKEARGDDANAWKLDLAASYLLEGMSGEARRVLDSLPDDVKRRPAAESKSGYSAEREREERLTLQYALARASLEPGGPDAFRLMTDILSKGGSGGDEGDPIGTVLWQRLFARYAAAACYRSIVAFVLQRSSRYLGYLAESEHSEPNEKAQAAAGKEEIDRELASLSTPATEEGVAIRAAEAAKADPTAPLIERLLASPRLSPFRESSLPEGIQPTLLTEASSEGDELAPGDDTPASAGTGRFAAFTFPAGFTPVRAERKGDEVAAIGISQDYDPVGEISRGAYWVIQSFDGGRTWGRRVYTGLRIEAPYVIHATSNLPMLAGDHLDVEVSVRELDESSITFPPVALRAKRVQDGLMLTIKFADLLRDTDRDGLTDLAEERLITDPSNPDSDGDGLRDADDSLPQVPWSGVMDEKAAALLAVLEDIAGLKPMGIIHEIPADGATADDLLAKARRPTLTDDETLFFVGQRPDFRSLVTSQRVVVLTSREADLARKKFGPLMPLELALFVLDHAESQGYVIWDAEWRGGTLALEKSGSRWRVRIVSEWIT